MRQTTHQLTGAGAVQVGQGLKSTRKVREEVLRHRSRQVILSSFGLVTRSFLERTETFSFKHACLVLSIVFLFLGGFADTFAQTTLGIIVGQVHDSGGLALPDCTVDVRNVGTGATRQTSCDATGTWTMPSLAPGQYEVAIEKTGFRRLIRGVTVLADTTVSLDLPLALGSVTQQVEVSESAAALPLEKDTHELSQIVNGVALQNLPIAGRNYLSLAQLGPGAQAGTDNQEGGSAAFFGTLRQSIILSGQMVGHSTFLQDGVENVSLMANSANLMSVPEAIQEVNVESIGSNAKFDRPSVVNVITKSGTNSFHGQVYDYFQNNALNASTFFATTAPKLNYNNFGGNLGGPIIRDKLFGFFDYNGQRQSSTTTQRTIVPTAAEREGQLSADGVTIYEPGTKTPFPGNVIPASQISSFATKYLAFFPNPTGPLVNGINYQANEASTANINQYLGRIDYNISKNDTLSGTVQEGNSPLVQENYIPEFTAISANSGWNAYLQEIHVFSPNLVNVARIGYNRSILFATIESAGTRNWTQEFGLDNLQPAPIQQAPPTVSVSGNFTAGNPYAPDGATQNRFEYGDEVNWTRGRHSMFIGAELDRTQLGATWVIWNDGEFDFNGQYTGLGLADFLLGFPYQASGGIGHTAGAFREYDVDGYFQDDWKVSSKLTLNLGLRYEYYGPVNDKNGYASVYNIVTNVNTPGSWASNYLNLAPRIGFAYAVTNNTVIRGGYGIYYYPFNYNDVQWLVAKPPNFSLQVQSEGPTSLVPVEEFFSAPPVGSSLAPFTVSPRMPTSYSEQWNLNIERSIGANYIFSVAYVGNNSLHGPLRFTPNQAVPEDPANPTPVNSRRPYPYIGEVNAVYNIDYGNYNALQTYLQRRFASGLQFQVNYTWSHALDLVDGDGPYVGNGLDPRANYGTAGFDRQQVFVANAIYDLPIGTGKPFVSHRGWFSEQVAGGWRLSAIFTTETGQPFSVDAADTANIGGTREAFASRVCNGTLPSGERNRNHWFDTSCFVQPPNGVIGDSGRNILRDPGVTALNFSAFKSFPFGEGRYVQFRADAFNALNHPYFIGPYSQNVTSSSYGSLPTAAGNRTIQFAMHVVF